MRLYASNRTMAETYYFLGTIHAKRNQFDEAVGALSAVPSPLNPSYGKAYERLAQLYIAHNTRLDEALELAQKAVEIQPNSVSNLNTLSWLYYLNRDYFERGRSHSKRPNSTTK